MGQFCEFVEVVLDFKQSNNIFVLNYPFCCFSMADTISESMESLNEGEHNEITDVKVGYKLDQIGHKWDKYVTF